jgi:hypothetical protein
MPYITCQQPQMSITKGGPQGVLTTSFVEEVFKTLSTIQETYQTLQK